MGVAPWELQDFGVCITKWIQEYHPTTEMLVLAVQWAFSRSVDPYVKADRVPADGPTSWIAVVPTPEECQDVVVAAIQILEVEHAVRCESIDTLSASILGVF